MLLTIKIALKLRLKIALKVALKNTLKNYVRNKKKMSFLKISDPVKRDLIVKEYLQLKKNIRDNLLCERAGEQQLQTDLSKFFKPITETQKATTREIMEELKPISEGIENLPQATQAPEEEMRHISEIADKYFNEDEIPPIFCDKIYKRKGVYYIGNKQARYYN